VESLTPEAVLEALTRVARTMLQLEPLPLPELSSQQEAPERRDRLTAMVSLSGAWRGVVLLSCGRRLAELACQRMLAPVGGEAGLEETLDALGELTNMLAGQIKALLPRPTAIGPPQVSGLGGTAHLLRDARPVVLLSCELASDELLVQVYQRG